MVNYETLNDAIIRGNVKQVMESTKAAIGEGAENVCWVGGKRVRFPVGSVEWAIRTSPSQVVLFDRDGKRKLFLEGKNSCYDREIMV